MDGAREVSDSAAVARTADTLDGLVQRFRVAV
jgi:hypothetical protein